MTIGFRCTRCSVLYRERFDAYGTIPPPFGPGAHRRVAVKMVDYRGIVGLKIIPTP